MWFDGQAEEAARFYTSLFNNSKINDVMRIGEGGPAPAGSVLTVAFELDGQEFTALNGGPQYKFTEAMSLMVNCESQAEVDRLWGALTEGGEEQPCGWLKDRYGLSWQIIPTMLSRMLQDEDPQKAQRVMNAMLQMSRIDTSALQAAYAGA